jgi:hypothetical protein
MVNCLRFSFSVAEKEKILFQVSLLLFVAAVVVAVNILINSLSDIECFLINAVFLYK